MAAFTGHCALTFWKGEDVLGPGVASKGARRLARTLEWLAEGKKRNWKYEKR